MSATSGQLSSRLSRQRAKVGPASPEETRPSIESVVRGQSVDESDARLVGTRPVDEQVGATTDSSTDWAPTRPGQEPLIQGALTRSVSDSPTELTPGWQHWTLNTDEHGTTWLTFDRYGSAVNLVDISTLEELDEIIARLEATQPQAVVLQSGKSTGFCAGADIGMFRAMDNSAEVADKLRWAHNIVDRFERLPATKIAAIHGACLGGGLELALACDYRIAVEDAKLGFPEVQLGLHPGLGGSFRSTALIDPLQAMTLMLTGRPVDAYKAKKLGLVDAVVPERHLAAALADAVAHKIDRHERARYTGLLVHDWGRELAARRMESETSKRVSRSHYPAPFQLIDLWRRHGDKREAMQQGEIDSFAQLVASPSGQNLVRVFFLREKLKKEGDTPAPLCRHVHVVGAGTMGGDIAAWCALQGMTVTLNDRDNSVLAKALQRTAQLCKKRRLGPRDIKAVLDRLIPDPTGDGAASADLLIEAVPENMDIKRAVYNELQLRMKPDALLATNTSSIPLEILCEEVADPGRFVGLHFFNPVAQMQLVEVVSHAQASAASLARARAFAGTIDRLPVPVRSAPGFLVNRVLTPYLLEAIVMLEEGIAAETIDRAAIEFGMPMGPLEMADRVGLDVCIAVADMLRERLPHINFADVPEPLRNKVRQGHTGQKSGQGFYRWKNGQAEKGKAEVPSAGSTDRLILPLLNACMACLREEVVADADTLDAAIVFGTGFAPFLGGPLHYAGQRGYAEVAQRLQQLAGQYGARFTPSVGWSEV